MIRNLPLSELDGNKAFLIPKKRSEAFDLLFCTNFKKNIMYLSLLMARFPLRFRYSAIIKSKSYFLFHTKVDRRVYTFPRLGELYQNPCCSKNMQFFLLQTNQIMYVKYFRSQILRTHGFSKCPCEKFSEAQYLLRDEFFKSKQIFNFQFY